MLTILPPDVAADRPEQKDDAANNRPAITRHELVESLPAELLIHLAHERVGITRLDRQFFSPNSEANRFRSAPSETR
jgi:hypothetical protein